MNVDKTIKWFLLSMWTIAMLAGGVGIGHRQMKRWQDNYYKFNLSKPVCSGEKCIIIPVSEWERLVRESFHPVVSPAPPKKAKPAKARPRIVQPIPEQELILNCAPNFDCSKGLPAAKP